MPVTSLFTGAKSELLAYSEAYRLSAGTEFQSIPVACNSLGAQREDEV